MGIVYCVWVWKMENFKFIKFFIQSKMEMEIEIYTQHTYTLTIYYTKPIFQFKYQKLVANLSKPETDFTTGFVLAKFSNLPPISTQHFHSEIIHNYICELLGGNGDVIENLIIEWKSMFNRLWHTPTLSGVHILINITPK